MLPLAVAPPAVLGVLGSAGIQTLAIAAVALLAAIASVVALVVVARRKGGFKSVFQTVIDKFLARPEQYSYTLFSGLIVLCMVVIGAFGWAFSRFASETEMGSTGVVEVLLGYGTNFMLWAGLTVVGVVVIFRRLNPHMAASTAEKTRFTEKEVEQIGAEVKTTDGTSRLIGDRVHSIDQLRAKLLRVFNGENVDEGLEELDSLAPESKLDTADETEHGGAIGPEVAGELPEPGSEGGPDILPSYGDDEDRPAPAWLDVFEGALDAELLASQLDYDPGRRDRRSGDIDTDADASRPEQEPEASATDGETAEESGLDPVGAIQRRLQLVRMDAAAASSTDELYARFLVPVVLTALGCFTMLGTVWIHPVLYGVIAGVSLLVGSLVYTGFKWRRRKNVRQARRTSSPGGWAACDVLTKRCTTERGTEFYVAWMGGNQYFGFDKHRVARKVASRWHQRLNGEVVAPAIHEYFAKSARSMMPLTHHIEYRDERRGRGAIYDTVADVIRSADDGIVPKMHLCELVVDRGPGVGFDPDIVGEVYEDMVGDAIEEFEVELRNTDGELVPVTLVALRTGGVPLDMEALRSEFSNQVSPEDNPLYVLPDVEETFDIEDALSVGVPPGVDPAKWADARTSPPEESPQEAA